MQYPVDGRLKANQLAFEKLTQSDPVLVDIRRAGDVVPGFDPHKILTSGPPTPLSLIHI